MRSEPYSKHEDFKMRITSRKNVDARMLTIEMVFSTFQLKDRFLKK